MSSLPGRVEAPIQGTQDYQPLNSATLRTVCDEFLTTIRARITSKLTTDTPYKVFQMYERLIVVMDLTIKATKSGTGVTEQIVRAQFEAIRASQKVGGVQEMTALGNNTERTQISQRLRFCALLQAIINLMQQEGSTQFSSTNTIALIVTSLGLGSDPEIKKQLASLGIPSK